MQQLYLYILTHQSLLRRFWWIVPERGRLEVAAMVLREHINRQGVGQMDVFIPIVAACLHVQAREIVPALGAFMFAGSRAR